MEAPSAEDAADPEPQGSECSRDSGRVSQSQSSSASGAWDDELPGRDLPLLRRAAAAYAAGLLPRPETRPEVAALDAGLEELLTRVDEFVGLLDLLRGDSSLVVREGVPRLHAKAALMRRVYGRIDRLEAFVRMVGARVARLEEQVGRAEAELGAFPSTLRRLLHSVSVPGLFQRAPPGRTPVPAPAQSPTPARYEPPALFRTEDYFPGRAESPQV